MTTLFPHQGHYAMDPKELAAHPRADLSIDRICDLLKLDLDSLLEAGRGENRSYER